MKRDEAVLKKTIEEVNTLKRQAKLQTKAVFDPQTSRTNRDNRKNGVKTNG